LSEEKSRCLLKGYEGTMESLCHVCLHKEVCVVPMSKIVLWVDFCTRFDPDNSMIVVLERLGRIRRKKP